MSYSKMINVVILAAVLVGCAGSKKKREVFVPEGEPEWLYSPQSGCSAAEICASGEGSSQRESDANAKKSLASIFETRIKSEFEFSKHTFSGDEVEEMKEFVNDRVNEQVDVILKGAEIKERFKRNELMFSLIRMNKVKASEVLKQELSRIDQQMRHMFKQKSRLYLKKLNMLFNQRELLNEKLTIIDNTGIPRPFTFGQINSLKYNSKGGSRIKFMAKDSVPKVLQKKMEEVLSEIGYKLSKKGDFDYRLDLKFEAKEEYLNVKGFKKITFQLNVDSKSNIGKRLGGFVITKVSNGRSEKDAFLKVREVIISEFESKLEKLNLN